MCINSRRPIPQRVDTIGTWLDTLIGLTWFGALTQPTLVYMFREGPTVTRDVSCLLGVCVVVLLSEHIYFICNFAIQQVLSKVPVMGEITALREAYTVRSRYLDKSNILSSSAATVLSEKSSQDDETPSGFWAMHGTSVTNVADYGVELLRG